MADLSDVTAFLAGLATTAIYPNGTGQPSVANLDCRIFEGWPLPDQLDMDMAGTMLQNSVVTRPGGPVANVSVFPMPGTGVSTNQILDDTFVISQPVYGMTPVLAGNVLTVGGQPNEGEYLTVELNRGNIYSRTGTTTAVLLAALLLDIQSQYPTATGDATSITFPDNFSLLVRQGGKGVMGKVTWRQRHDIMVTTWAHNHAVRKTLADAVDNYIKQNIRVTLPDTSQAIIRYSRTNISDEQQVQTIYRRDLIYQVEYATVQQFPGYVITSITQNNSLFNFIS